MNAPSPRAAAPSAAIAGGRVVLALGVTQTLAWASSTYLPAILAGPMARALGITPGSVFAAYSAALLLMAALGPRIGGLIDRHGGRPVLCASNLVLALALCVLGSAAGPAAMVAGWMLLGTGMALGLYDAAFAALVRIYGGGARGPITGITLLGGFASTLGWPLTSALLEGVGWRGACFAWAAIHLLVALPINWRCVPAVAKPDAPRQPAPAASPPAAPAAPAGQRFQLVLLAVFGACTSFATSAMSAHLPGLFVLTGVGTSAALFAASLFGPAQVAARLFEYFVLHRRHLPPLLSARIACALHPVGSALLLALGGSPALAVTFALLHGAGNGMITIAKGTLPLALFGPHGYGARQGWLAVAPRIMLAIAPFAFGQVMLDFGAQGALLLTTGVSLLALAALLLLRLAR